MVIVVDAKPGGEPVFDRKPNPPGLISVLSTAASLPVANYSSDTVELLRQHFSEWDRAALNYAGQRRLCREIAERECRRSRSPETCQTGRITQCYEDFRVTDANRPPHPKLYRLHVRFDTIQDDQLRRRLQAIPTKLQLPAKDVELLIEAASLIIEQSPAFKNLIDDLK